MKEINFEERNSKQFYIDQGYEEVLIGIPPEQIILIKQARRKQYGLKHQIAGTINASMGDTEVQIATEISATDPNFRMWEKGQLIVLISRTRLGKDTIFVGNKQNTLKALKNLLTKKTMWNDFVEQV